MTDMKEFVVAKANALVQASYKLSLNEQRLVLACVAQLDSRKPLPKDNLFTLQAADFAETYCIPVDQAYEALNEASNSLYERDIKVFDGRVKSVFAGFITLNIIQAKARFVWDSAKLLCRI